MSFSQKNALIKLIHKKNDRHKLKNYRPISLLNTDVKIVTKVLAKRLAMVLKNIIHESQKCVPGRQITDNIHIAQDLIDLINEQENEAAFIFLDQEKAFDRISHNFLFKTLEKFGFGNNFINWIKIFYNNVNSQIKLNGKLSEKIEIEQGLRQGCPLSALLYVLCAEVLQINIRKDPRIKGYKLENFEMKGLSFADDMMTVVTSEDSIHALFDLISSYEKATNAKINIDKTEAIWVGKWRDNSHKPLGLKWVNNYVKFVGVFIGNNRKEASKISFNEIIESIKKKLSYWNTKSISVKGKVKIINTFVLSKLWYVLETHDLPENMLLDLKNILTTFIWKGHKQVSYEFLCLSYEEGGLSLQNIKVKQDVLRIKSETSSR